MRKRQNISVSMNDLNDNQFIDRSVSGPNKRQSMGNLQVKDSRIKKLQERNIMLQRQVIKIERALVGVEEKETYGIKLPQIKGDVIKRQLQNAYKMIKQYQHEITKRQKYDLDGTYVEQVRKYEQILKQKQQLNQKIRKQIFEHKKQSTQITKLLKDDIFKKQKEQKEDKDNADIKWLQQKIKKANQKKKQQEGNLERQRDLIKKIQKQLVKLQYSHIFLENIRNKIFVTKKHQNTDESEQEIQQDEQPKDGQPDRTPFNLEIIQTEIKLYTKLEKDYDQRINFLIQENKEAQQKNYKSRNKLVETQYQIQKIQERIQQLKQLLNPKALIPTKMDMIIEEKKRYHSVKKIEKIKLNILHLFKYAEVGQATKAGKRFIDRPTIGKKVAKIVQIVFFEKKDSSRDLLGFQAVYLIDKQRKKSNINILGDKSLVQQKQFTLEQGDFVKSIDCMLNEQKVIVGISMVSRKNVIVKGGLMTVNRSTIPMESNQYPICLYGCLLEIGFEMVGAEIAQE